MNLMDPFQLRIFYDPMISCCVEYKRSQDSFPRQQHLQALSVHIRAKSWRPEIHKQFLPLGHLDLHGSVLQMN